MRWQYCVGLVLLALPLLGACSTRAEEPAHAVSGIDWSDGSRIVQRTGKSPREQAAEAGGAVEVTVTDSGFQPAVINALVGNRVKIYLQNQGQHEHNLVIPRFGIVTQPLVRGGDTYVEFTASQKGRWPFFSNAPGVQERGLAGELIVE
jgi:plastocyanin